ncbi:crossover junction endonuclease MUS81-like [Chlorella sorokiniana]|uniref:Crossover junction endonuclease MUS81 n=1 Tax=Chlorella sorokiniana TaxID=3076 RepID=A0A2P6TGR2_CHLSO|nr:crossover junction endonuclease MUS81-like [Chlorella sorokiniana]|eukprot:PRW33317.1 crossover junction endonuclease MUS81-like [Chlorella sorokiniana]
MRDYTPQTGSVPFACLIELYQEGGCPSGPLRRVGVKKETLAALVDQRGLARTDPHKKTSRRGSRGQHYSVTALADALGGLRTHNQGLVTYEKKAWKLQREGERIARNLCLRHGIELPDWDQAAQHALQQPQQLAEQQPPQAQRPRRQRQPQRQQQEVQQVQQGSLSREAAGAAAIARQQQQQQQQQPAAAAGTAAVEQPGRLAGTRRSAPEVVDLLGSGCDSEDDSDADLLVSPFKRSRPQPVDSRGGSEGAGPSHVGRRLLWEATEQQRQPLAQQAQQQQQAQQTQRAQQQAQQPSPGRQEAVQQLAELCQASLADAQAALEAWDGDLDAAADFLFKAQQQQHREQPVQQEQGQGQQQQQRQQQQQQRQRQQQQRQRQQQQRQEQAQAPHQPGAAAAAAAAGAHAPAQAGAAAAFNPGAAWPLRQRLALPPLAPGQAFQDAYEIVLLVDSRELQATLAQLQAALGRQGVAVESRCLPVGDMLWVARDRATGAEHVLPFVLERKSSQDLLSSIRDGRYLQQKWRMLSSGLPHRLYLVETAGDAGMSDRDKRAVQTARTTTAVVDSFRVLHSKDFEHRNLRPNTIDWLCGLSRSIADRCTHEAAQAARAGPAPGGLMTFEHLSDRVKAEEEKALAGSAQWQLALMAAPGVPLGAAEAIAAAYPSPAALLQAVRQAGRLAVARRLAVLRHRVGGGEVMSEASALHLLSLLFPGQQQPAQQPAARQQQQQQQQQAVVHEDVIDLTCD